MIYRDEAAKTITICWQDLLPVVVSKSEFGENSKTTNRSSGRSLYNVVLFGQVLGLVSFVSNKSGQRALISSANSRGPKQKESLFYLPGHLQRELFKECNVAKE